MLVEEGEVVDGDIQGTCRRISVSTSPFADGYTYLGSATRHTPAALAMMVL